MRKATSVIAAAFGIFAGFGGVEHGYFEVLQGNTRPEGLMIASMGPPCVPEQVWHLCEPAMTVLPGFLLTGIVSMGFGLATMLWSTAFVRRPRGGLVLVLLSLGLLLFGGGIFPPLIGIVGGVVGMRIHKPLRAQPGPFWRLLGATWPWVLILLFVGLFSQFVVGYFFNDWLMENGAILLALPVLLVVSILAAYGYDLQRDADDRALAAGQREMLKRKGFG